MLCSWYNNNILFGFLAKQILRCSLSRCYKMGFLSFPYHKRVPIIDVHLLLTSPQITVNSRYRHTLGAWNIMSSYCTNRQLLSHNFVRHIFPQMPKSVCLFTCFNILSDPPTSHFDRTLESIYSNVNPVVP